MSDYWPLLVMLAVLGAVGVVLALRDWRVGAVLIAIALPFEGLLPTAGASGMKALVATVAVSLAMHLMRNAALLTRALANLRSGVSLALLALIAWSTLSLMWALSPQAALARTFTFCGVFVLLHLFALLDERFLRLAWTALLASAAITVPAGLLLDGREAFSEEGRFAAGGLNPNDYAGLLVVILFVAAGALRGRLAPRALLGLAVLAGVFLSGSRTALVALALAPILHLLLAPRGTRGPALYRAAAAYAAAVAVILGAYAVDPPHSQTLHARALTLVDYRNADTWAGRLDIWSGGTAMIRERPVIGMGAGNFAVAAPTVSGMPRRSDQSGRGPVAHNVFIGMTAELGVVGLALFGWMWLAAIGKARSMATDRDLLLPLIACLLMSLSLSWEYAKIVYVLMGSVLALGQSPALRT